MIVGPNFLSCTVYELRRNALTHLEKSSFLCVVVSSGGMGHSWKKVENSVGKKTNKQTDGTEDCRVVVRTEHGLKSGVF
jgi:hypothetical protein